MKLDLKKWWLLRNPVVKETKPVKGFSVKEMKRVNTQ